MPFDQFQHRFWECQHKELSGAPGAFNAGLLAAQILAGNDAALLARLQQWRAERSREVLENPNPAGNLS